MEVEPTKTKLSFLLLGFSSPGKDSVVHVCSMLKAQEMVHAQKGCTNAVPQVFGLLSANNSMNTGHGFVADNWW